VPLAPGYRPAPALPAGARPGPYVPGPGPVVALRPGPAAPVALRPRAPADNSQTGWDWWRAHREPLTPADRSSQRVRIAGHLPAGVSWADVRWLESQVWLVGGHWGQARRPRDMSLMVACTRERFVRLLPPGTRVAR
jgi:hypothetical protein